MPKQVPLVKSKHSVNNEAELLGVSSKNKDAFRPIFGLGGYYEFYPNVTANLSWMSITSGSGIKTSNLLGVGLTFFIG